MPKREMDHGVVSESKRLFTDEALQAILAAVRADPVGEIAQQVKAALTAGVANAAATAVPNVVDGSPITSGANTFVFANAKWRPGPTSVRYDAEATKERVGAITEAKIDALATKMDLFIKEQETMSEKDRRIKVAEYASDARYLLQTSNIDNFVSALLNIDEHYDNVDCGCVDRHRDSNVADRAFYAIRLWIVMRPCMIPLADVMSAGISAYQSCRPATGGLFTSFDGKFQYSPVQHLLNLATLSATVPLVPAASRNCAIDAAMPMP